MGAEYSPKLEQLWRYKQPFKFNIIVDCHKLLEDFVEDLEFHFSFGIDAILRRIIAFSRGRPITSLGRDHFTAALNYPQSSEQNNQVGRNKEQQEYDQYMVKMISLSASYLANGTIGAVLVGTLVRVILLK